MKVQWMAVIACAVLVMPGCRREQIGRGAWVPNTPQALEAIGFIPQGDRVVSQPFTMSVVVSKTPLNASYADMAIWQEIQEVTGVTFNFIEIPSTSFDEQRNLMLASGDLPDVFLTGITDADQVRYGPAGLFVPLEGIIRDYAPRIQGLFDERPDIRRAMVTPDGHQYVLPGLEELVQRTNIDNAFINKTWLDSLGLAIPTTPEELLTVLRAFRDRDPNGNGRRDEIPFAFAQTFGDQFNIYSMYAAFGEFDYPNHLVVRDGRVVFTAITEEWRNATRYFRQLFAEGLIDPEAFTQDRGIYFSKGVEPDMLYGVFFGFFDENVVGTERALEHYVALPPLFGTDGRRHWNKWPDYVLERFCFAITRNMQYPEVAIRVADLFFDTDYSFQLKYGPFGVTLGRDGDQIMQLPPPPGMSMDEFRYTHAPAVNVPFALREADFERFAQADNAMRKHERYLMYSRYFIPDENIYPRVFFLPAEQEELALLNIDVADYVKEMRAKFIMGSEDIEGGWDAYLRRLERGGLERYLEIYQAALDRYLRS